MNTDKVKIKSAFWKAPTVFDHHTLIDPFFTKKPLPHFLTTESLNFFLDGLHELAQLVHVVAINTPVSGNHVNYVLREFLSFHVDHFTSIGFRDVTFMQSLRPRNETDEDAKAYIAFLKRSSQEFLGAWEAARVAVNNNEHDAVEIQRLWVNAKNVADAISLQTSSMEYLPTRIVLRLPLWRLVDIYTTQGRLPNWLIYLWLLWGITVAFFLDIMIWVLVKNPSFSSAMICTVVCTSGFGGFLLFFYTLCRRRTLADWYSKEMSGNLSRSYFKYASYSVSAPDETGHNLEFLIQPRGTGVLSRLSLQPTIINRQVVMIGVSDVSSLRICSWNLCARSATDISWEDAIGKPLAALMEPRSVAAVQQLFNQIQQNPRQQKRLLFNSISKGTVAIKATATIAHVDGVPIGMIVGTVLEEEERAMMSYFSRTGLTTLLDKLDEKKLNDPVTRELALSNSWDQLKERTTQAIRSWRFSTAEELAEPFHCTDATFRISVSFGNRIPSQFQCDSNFIRSVFGKIRDAIRERRAGVSSFLEVHVDAVEHAQEQCVLLQFDLHSDNPIFIPDDVVGALRSVGYLFSQSPRDVVLRLPISPSPIASKEMMEAQKDLAKLFICTFIIFEPDSVYASHLINFCVGYQYRAFRVDPDHPVKSLEDMVESIGHDVTAVLLSVSSSHFPSMLAVCKRYNVYTVGTKPPLDGNPNHFFRNSFDGVPREGRESGLDYVLHLPLGENSWKNLLDALHDMKQHKKTVDGIPRHRYDEVRTIASGTFGKVDLVRETLTGGVMARKTVYVTQERPLKSITAEVEIMNVLGEHPNIVCCINSYSKSSTEYCMLLQYCKEGNVSRFVSSANHGQLSLAQVALFARQLLEAVRHIHSRGVAHRDIKPANIMMTDHLHIKLGDFGSATLDPSQAGSLAGGTLRFAAPERLIDSTSPSSPAVAAPSGMAALYAEDMWSVGVTLLDLAGCLPPQLVPLTEFTDFVDLYVRLRNERRELEPPVQGPALASEPEYSVFTDFIKHMVRIRPTHRSLSDALLQHPFVASVSLPAADDEPSVSASLVHQQGSSGGFGAPPEASPFHLNYSSSEFSACSNDDGDENSLSHTVRFTNTDYNSVLGRE